jgi:hypothetical protein
MCIGLRNWRKSGQGPRKGCTAIERERERKKKSEECME